METNVVTATSNMTFWSHPPPPWMVNTSWWVIQIAVVGIVVVAFIVQIVLVFRGQHVGRKMWSQIVLGSALLGLLTGLATTVASLRGTMDILGSTHAGDIPLLALSYHCAAVPSLYGGMILALGCLLNSIARSCELAREKRQPNQASQPIAGKPGSG